MKNLISIGLLFTIFISCKDDQVSNSSACSNISVSENIKSSRFLGDKPSLKFIVCNSFSVKAGDDDIIVVDGQWFSESDAPETTSLNKVTFEIDTDNQSDTESFPIKAGDEQIVETIEEVPIEDENRREIGVYFRGDGLGPIDIEFNQTGKTDITVGEVNELLKGTAIFY